MPANAGSEIRATNGLGQLNEGVADNGVHCQMIRVGVMAAASWDMPHSVFVYALFGRERDRPPYGRGADCWPVVRTRPGPVENALVDRGPACAQKYCAEHL